MFQEKKLEWKHLKRASQWPFYLLINARKDFHLPMLSGWASGLSSECTSATTLVIAAAGKLDAEMSLPIQLEFCFSVEMY